MTPTTKNNSTSPTTRRSKCLHNMALELPSSKGSASPPSSARTKSAAGVSDNTAACKKHNRKPRSKLKKRRRAIIQPRRSALAGEQPKGSKSSADSTLDEQLVVLNTGSESSKSFDERYEYICKISNELAAFAKMFVHSSKLCADLVHKPQQGSLPPDAPEFGTTSQRENGSL